jgi:hypothetical protein
METGMKMVNATVRRSALQTQNVTVPPWEIAVLEAVHGSGDVVVHDTVEVEREIPNAAAELERLAKLYGVDVESGISWAEQVYGQHRAGFLALQKEIQASLARGKRKAGDGEPADADAA